MGAQGTQWRPTTSLPSSREAQTTLKTRPFAFTQLCFQVPQTEQWQGQTGW